MFARTGFLCGFGSGNDKEDAFRQAHSFNGMLDKDFFEKYESPEERMARRTVGTGQRTDNGALDPVVLRE